MGWSNPHTPSQRFAGRGRLTIAESPGETMGRINHHGPVIVSPLGGEYSLLTETGETMGRVNHPVIISPVGGD